MFKKVLIANRGEIACRVIRACKKLGIRTVAVYSYPDVDAPHVWEAEEAYYLGPAPANASYLNIEKILRIAQQARAEAIHPGYGFLSENPEFAERCRALGITFIGPSPATLRQVGNKPRARATMQQINLPILPGYTVDAQDDAGLLEAANSIGYPLLVKAAEGGGGIGIGIVRDPSELKFSVESAVSRAQKAFGKATFYLERYLESARHVEVQVLADTHGTYVHLFERECSVQRRYQKILEESPSTAITPAVRAAMAQAALQGMRAVGYTNAGTVEFLVDQDGQFYFLEVNPRIQVEHGVTELVTGLDLVELQLRIAAGEKLPFSQEEVRQQGHAMECRVCAEDPRTFFPSPGRITRLEFPSSGENVRVDIGIAEGQEVTIYYDSLLAKVLTWDLTRQDCARRMSQALEQFVVEGLDSNIPLLRRILSHPDFLAGRYDTQFLTRLQQQTLASS
jgi:acetyl-CoA carboxylase biotin carboxylase subunit